MIHEHIIMCINTLYYLLFFGIVEYTETLQTFRYIHHGGKSKRYYGYSNQ